MRDCRGSAPPPSSPTGRYSTLLDDGLVLRSVHPGENIDAVAAETPVPLETSGARETAAPTDDELRLIREELDPNGWYTA